MTCHGIAGRGGVVNYNYIKKTVPAHNRTAEKIFLADAQDRQALLNLIQQGTDLNKPDEPPDITRYRLVMARFRAAVELIKKGKQAARLDMAGPEPPLQMPAWQDKLSRRQIHAIMGYFISLATDPDGSQALPVPDLTIPWPTVVTYVAGMLVLVATLPLLTGRLLRGVRPADEIRIGDQR